MRTLTLLALSMTLVAGCKAVDAMDNTETMKTDLASMKQTMNGMNGTTGHLDSGTTELTRLAKVAKADDALDMSKHDYTFYLPPPGEILAGGQLFGENANEKELLDWMFAHIKEMNESVPDGSMQDNTLVGGYPAKYVSKFNTDQMVRGVILQSVAGQIPQDMIQKLIQDQIYGGGSRADVVQQILMLRAMFLDSFLIDKDAFHVPVKQWDIGMARKASEHISNLRFITQLPFADKISFSVASTSFLPALNPPQIAMPAPFTQVKPVPADPQNPTDSEKQAIADYNTARAGWQQQAADFQAKCVQASPVDPGCLPTTTDFSGVSVYNAQLDNTLDQKWWKKLDRGLEGYTDCKGKQHPSDLDMRGVSSQDAHDYAVIADAAKRNYPAETCPAK
jgi:hypothetical protein